MITTKTVKLGELEINLEELAEFLVRAKKAGYASGIEPEKLQDGSKRFSFQEGNFHYEDDFAGYYQASGTEIVRWQKPEGQRIWQMSYSGGMNSKFIGDKKFTKEVFSFLKKALLQLTPEKPFRGPERVWPLNNSPFSYRAHTKGDIKNFNGEESISYTHEESIHGQKLVFSQNYVGGLVIPK